MFFEENDFYDFFCFYDIFLLAISLKNCMSFTKNDIWQRCRDSEKLEVFTLEYGFI